MPDPQIAPSDAPSAPSPAPRPERASVMLVATVERPARPASRHRVRNLSTGGIRIDNADTLRAGDAVTISVGAIHRIAATVRWAREGLAGLAFAEAIEPDDARGKAAVAPRARPAGAIAPEVGPVPTAGWIGELRNAYHGQA